MDAVRNNRQGLSRSESFDHISLSSGMFSLSSRFASHCSGTTNNCSTQTRTGRIKMPLRMTNANLICDSQSNGNEASIEAFGDINPQASNRQT